MQQYGDTKRSTAADRSYALLYPLLDLTTTLDPLFDVAYQFGALFLAEPPPGGPGRPDLAIALLQKGLAAQPDNWRLHPGARVRPLLVAPGLRARPPTGSIARRKLPGRADLDGAAGGRDAGAGRQPRGVAPAVAADRRDRDRRLVPQRGGAPPAAARRDGPARRCSTARGGVPATHRAAARGLGRSWRGLGMLRGSRRRSRPACRIELERPAARSIRSRGSCRCPRGPAQCRGAAGRRRVLRAFGLHRRQLPQRLHLPAAAQAVDRVAGVALHRRAGAPLSWYENVPVVSWLALRGRCRTLPDADQRQYPIVEAVTGALFGAGVLLYGADRRSASSASLFGCAMIVLFVIDLQHRILPNVITVPGTVVGLVLSLFLPPGWRVVAHRRAGRRRRAVRDRRGLLPAARRRGAGHGRREDAGDDRRVPRLAARARDADAGVVRRRGRWAWRCSPRDAARCRRRCRSAPSWPWARAIAAVVGDSLVTWYVSFYR